MNGVIKLVTVLAAIVLGAPAALAALEIGPEDSLCTAIHSVPPGEELVLRPGDYAGPCNIRNGGAPDRPLVIRAADPAQRPQIVYTGTTSDVLNVWADHVTLRGLRFGPTRGDVDAIRIRAHRHITIEDCEFTAIAGLAIAANNSSVAGLIVRGNVVRDSRSTAFYFGCHDGRQCALSDLVVEGNYVHGAGLGEQGVGYGLQVKLNSSGVVRDNVIVETKGPGIMVYGSWYPDRVSLIERNFVAVSRRSSGIVVGGGPAIVRNNVAVANIDSGIGLEDYNQRGLLRGVVVAHNTVHANERAGVSVPETVHDAVVVNNALQAPATALPGAGSRLVVAGNVDCSLAAAHCFADAAARDFSPGPLLAGIGAVRTDAWAPTEDFFGVRRATPPSVGAVERSAGPIAIGVKTRP